MRIPLAPPSPRLPQPPHDPKPRVTNRKVRVGVTGATNRPGVPEGDVRDLYAWPREALCVQEGTLVLGCQELTTMHHAVAREARARPQSARDPQPPSKPYNQTYNLAFQDRAFQENAPASRPGSARGRLESQRSEAAPASRPGSPRVRPSTGRPDNRRTSTAGAPRDALVKQQATAAQAGGEAPEASKEEVVESITGLLRRRMRAKRIIAPVFRDMDVEKTGFLNYNDFDAAIRRLGIEAPKEHIRWVAESIDGDGGGYIDYNDFATAVSGDAAADEDGYFGSELKLAASKLVDGERQHDGSTRQPQPQPQPQPPPPPLARPGTGPWLGRSRACGRYAR